MRKSREIVRDPCRNVPSQYIRQPNEKVTLSETQALLSAGIAEAVTPLRVACRWAVIASGVSLLVAIVAVIVAVLT